MTVQAPEAINYSSGKRILTLSFPGEDPVELSAELLRVLSPSAEVPVSYTHLTLPTNSGV